MIPSCFILVCPMRTNGVSQQETIEDDNEESDGYDTDSSNGKTGNKIKNSSGEYSAIFYIPTEPLWKRDFT